MEKTNKALVWFRDNVSFILIVVLVIVNTLYGLLTITSTGKTVSQIIVDSSTTLLLGIIIKHLCRKQGLISGERSEQFVSTKQLLSNSIERIIAFYEYLYVFCDIENEIALKKERARHLAKYMLTEEEVQANEINFIEEDYYTKKEWKKLPKYKKKLIKNKNKEIARSNNLKLKGLKQVNKLDVLEITPLDLTTEYEEKDKTKKDSLNTSTRGYETKRALFNNFSTIFTTIIFGIFMVDISKGFNWENALWSLIKMLILLAFGVLEMLTAYNYMTYDIRNKLKVKNAYLEKFYNEYTKNPSMYENKKKGVNNELSTNIQKQENI